MDFCSTQVFSVTLAHYNSAQVEVEGQQSAPADLSHVWAPHHPTTGSCTRCLYRRDGSRIKGAASGEPWPAAGADDLLQFLGASLPVFTALNHTDVITCPSLLVPDRTGTCRIILV